MASKRYPRVTVLSKAKSCQVSRNVFYKDISAADAAAIQTILIRFSNHPRKCYCCAIEMSKQDLLSFFKSLFQSFILQRISSPKTSRPSQPPPSSVAQQRSTQAAAETTKSVSTSEQGTQISAILSRSNNTTSNVVQSPISVPHRLPTNRPHVTLWVIFGVQDRSEFTNIENIAMLGPLMSDAAFFKELKRLENKHRWPFLKWFSPYIFTYCKFVRVRTVHY